MADSQRSGLEGRFLIFHVARLVALGMVVLGIVIGYTDLLRPGGWPLVGSSSPSGCDRHVVLAAPAEEDVGRKTASREAVLVEGKGGSPGWRLDGAARW